MIIKINCFYVLGYYKFCEKPLIPHLSGFQVPKPTFNLFNNCSKHLYDNNSTYNVYACVILVGSIKRDCVLGKIGLLLNLAECY